MLSSVQSPLTWPQATSRHLAKLWQNPWLSAIVRFSALEDSLRLLHPTLSLIDVHARVVRVVDETSDTKTFILQPNWQWQRSTVRAGQFVRVQVEIAGRRVSRVYSLSSLPQAKQLAITVKRQGLFSNFLHRHIRIGSVLTISQAEGEFAMPATPEEVLPEKMLFISAGSGVTPIMAMLRELHARQYRGDVLFLHSCKDLSQQIFAKELLNIASRMPKLRVITHFSAAHGRMTAHHLQSYVPDFAQRSTWLCGPHAVMEMVRQYWQSLPQRQPLYSEAFSAMPRLPATAPGTRVHIHLQNSAQQFQTQGSASLLEQAEAAGLSPKHGCRIGICRSCQCTKRSGTVENLQTGEISSEPDELIRLCISIARSDTTLAL